jgi:hypothetical protein
MTLPIGPCPEPEEMGKPYSEFLNMLGLLDEGPLTDNRTVVIYRVCQRKSATLGRTFLRFGYVDRTNTPASKIERFRHILQREM